MSAICGVYGRPDAQRVVAAMAAPSEQLVNTWSAQELAFACRRAGGPKAAPIAFDTAANLAVAADARLDGRPALQDALGIRASERLRLTDAELILAAWKRWGQDSPQRLLGDYAFLVWDGNSRTLFCVRDALGVRPLYYARVRGAFFFASTIEALHSAPDVSSALDEDMVATHLTHVHIRATDRTFFRDVRRVSPGRLLIIRKGALRNVRHWHPERAPDVRLADADAYAQALADLIANAVRDRLNDGPIGAHVSGGLDSSGIAVLAARLLRERGSPPPLGFSFSPQRTAPLPDDWAREYALMDAVCEQEGLQVLHCSPSPKDVAACLRRDGAYPAGRVNGELDVSHRRMREQGVRVLLSGILGDEFASHSGFGHDMNLLLTGRLGALLVRRREDGLSTLGFLRRIGPQLMHHDFASFLRRRAKMLGPQPQGRLVAPALRRRARMLPRWGFPQGSVRHRQLWFLRNEVHLQDLEISVASGAKEGIEYRYPLADLRVVEFALGVPGALYRRGGCSRWLMRQALRGALPPAVRRNTVKTEPARHTTWMQATVQALAEIRLEIDAAKGPLLRSQYMDMERLRKSLAAPRTPERPRLMRILGALQLLDF